VHDRAPSPSTFDLAEVDRLLTTTRAVRKQLDLERPVPPPVIEECLQLAVQAPNATNAQSWRWLVVSDPVLRRKVGDVYGEVLRPISLQLREQRRVAGDADGLRHSDSVLHLVDHLGEVPVLVIPCMAAEIGPETGLADLTGMFGSIYPAVWSFQLALRSRGLGSAFTTAHLLRAAEVAEILGIPGGYVQTCLIPVAYSKRQDFSPAPRRPVAEVMVWDHWGSGNAGPGGTPAAPGAR
jgi:nitroreductase